MKTITALASCVAVVLAAGTLPAGEVPVKNVPGAEFKPGQLRLPLTVVERSGVDRKGTVVSSGVPFPPGFVTNLGKLAVVDRDGQPVVSQANLMVKWHKPAYDDSAQWALVSFAADVPANGTATYYLTDDGKVTPRPSPLTLLRGDRDITVNTGAASFVIPLSGEALLAGAKVGGKEVLAGSGLRAVITTGDWPDRNIRAGDKEVATHDVKGVMVEEFGPARVVVAITGQFAPGDKDGKFYGFITRLYFTAGSASIRVIHSVTNGRLNAKLEGGWRNIYTWPIKDASLVADLALGDKVIVLTTADDKAIASNKELLVYQANDKEFKVTELDRELASGKGHTGVLSVAGVGAGLSAALRNFRLEHPHAIAGSAKSLRVGLFPGEFSDPFPVNGGQRKSWDVRLTFFAKDTPPDAKAESAVADTLLLFRPEPAWMARTGAAGCWPYGLGLVKDPAPGGHALRRDKSRLGGKSTGWVEYGLIGDWNSGGHHWNEESMYYPWILWGDGANFDQIEAGSLWSADQVAFNYDDPDVSAFYLMLMGWNDHENRVRRLAYPGYRSRDSWGMPDSGHCGMMVLPDYYYLTGDVRARDAVVNLGQRARATLWKFNHDDKKDGTGPMPGAVGWCKRQDADTDPNFKLDTRYIGWPLFDLANAYRLTGDPQVLAECRNVAHAFRNTARYSPIGFMTLQIEPRGGTRDLYAFQGPFEKYRDLSASQCYAHFQMALMCHGLFEYYTMSRDVEALDPMIGFADLLSHHCMITDPQGKRRGWTYAFADYWGPYTWEDSGKANAQPAAWKDWHYNNVESLGWIAQFTGRADYVDVLKDAVAAYGNQPAFDAAAAVMATGHPHADQPPLALTDLKAEALGGGKVRLTWTARAGPTKATRYQVKYSTAKIVELVKGWPDRTEPLPTDRKEWEARAAAFNAKQRAFWAADNAPGPPVPGAAGAAESMTIERLRPGAYNFAIKAWSAIDTMGPLSNVAEVMVK